MYNASFVQHMNASQHRQQVSAALGEAHAAFSAQHAEPDGLRFKEACERLAQFLDLAIPMVDEEQNTLVGILQLACAMHENAINSPVLSRAQRTEHRRASCDLTVACNKVCYNSMLRPELRSEVICLSYRAEKAFAEDFSRCFFMENWVEEDIYGPAAPSPEPISYLPTPRASLHDINGSDARRTPRSVRSRGFHGSDNDAGPSAGHSVPTPSHDPHEVQAYSHNAYNSHRAPQPIHSYGSGQFGAGSSIVHTPSYPGRSSHNINGTS